MSQLQQKWFIEHTSPATAHMVAVERYIITTQTPYQQVDIADTTLFGRILVLDGKIQSAQLDEYIYHEALVHPAMLLSAAPRSILVIGGGEGATLREVYKHSSVERVVMVDLDQAVVELCRTHLQSWHEGSFEDSRLELIYADARDYLQGVNQKFDVIISDVPEPVSGGPALKLFTSQYFALIRDRLAPDGLLVLQAGDFSLPFISTHSAIRRTVEQVFPGSRSYRSFIPSFNSEWSFVIASSSGPVSLPPAKWCDEALTLSAINLRYLDGETLVGCFSLPADVRRILHLEQRVIDDNDLVSVY